MSYPEIKENKFTMQRLDCIVQNLGEAAAVEVEGTRKNSFEFVGAHASPSVVDVTELEVVEQWLARLYLEKFSSLDELSRVMSTYDAVGDSLRATSAFNMSCVLSIFEALSFDKSLKHWKFEYANDVVNVVPVYSYELRDDICRLCKSVPRLEGLCSACGSDDPKLFTSRVVHVDFPIPLDHFSAIALMDYGADSVLTSLDGVRSLWVKVSLSMPLVVCRVLHPDRMLDVMSKTLQSDRLIMRDILNYEKGAGFNHQTYTSCVEDYGKIHGPVLYYAMCLRSSVYDLHVSDIFHSVAYVHGTRQQCNLTEKLFSKVKFVGESDGFKMMLDSNRKILFPYVVSIDDIHGASQDLPILFRSCSDSAWVASGGLHPPMHLGLGDSEMRVRHTGSSSRSIADESLDVDDLDLSCDADQSLVVTAEDVALVSKKCRSDRGLNEFQDSLSGTESSISVSSMSSEKRKSASLEVRELYGYDVYSRIQYHSGVFPNQSYVYTDGFESVWGTDVVSFDRDISDSGIFWPGVQNMRAHNVRLEYDVELQSEYYQAFISFATEDLKSLFGELFSRVTNEGLTAELYLNLPGDPGQNDTTLDDPIFEIKALVPHDGLFGEAFAIHRIPIPIVDTRVLDTVVVNWRVRKAEIFLCKYRHPLIRQLDERRIRTLKLSQLVSNDQLAADMGFPISLVSTAKDYISQSRCDEAAWLFQVWLYERIFQSGRLYKVEMDLNANQQFKTYLKSMVKTLHNYHRDVVAAQYYGSGVWYLSRRLLPRCLECFDEVEGWVFKDVDDLVLFFRIATANPSELSSDDRLSNMAQLYVSLSVEPVLSGAFSEVYYPEPEVSNALRLEDCRSGEIYMVGVCGSNCSFLALDRADMDEHRFKENHPLNHMQRSILARFSGGTLVPMVLL